MKKYLILFAMCLFLCGCKNMNISSEVFDVCKRAVNITDDYLNHYITREDANSKISNLDCDYDSDNTDELYVCILITGLDIKFNSMNSTTNDIRESRNKLAKQCGI